MKFFQDANIISEHSKPRDSCIVEYCNNLHNENMDSKDLWVDKYKPSAYLDLLSDNVSILY